MVMGGGSCSSWVQHTCWQHPDVTKIMARHFAIILVTARCQGDASGTSWMVLINDHTICITSDKTLVYPVTPFSPAYAHGCRLHRSAKTTPHHGTISLSELMAMQKTTNRLLIVTIICSGSETDLKLGGVKQQQTG